MSMMTTRFLVLLVNRTLGNDVAVGDAFTVEADVASGDVTTNWQTVLQDSWTTTDGDINSGDVIICTTAAAVGNRTDARYNVN